MKNTLLSVFVCLTGIYTHAQIHINQGELVNLKASDVPAQAQELMEWQDSTANGKWKTIGNTPTLEVAPKENTFYRLKVYDPECSDYLYSNFQYVLVFSGPTLPEMSMESDECECGDWEDQTINFYSSDSSTTDQTDCGAGVYIDEGLWVFSLPNYNCPISSVCLTTSYRIEITDPNSGMHFRSGQNVTFNFLIPGTYTVEVTPMCGDAECESCTFTVEVNAEHNDCACQEWDDRTPLFTMISSFLNYNEVHECEDVYISEPGRYTFTLPQYNCAPEECETYYDWEIIAPNFDVYSGSGSSFYFDFTLQGPYSISITPTCGIAQCEDGCNPVIHLETSAKMCNQNTQIVDIPGANNTIWMDRNLGAFRQATHVNDSLAFGCLFQWGRDADGHENPYSNTTAILSTSDNPGHGDFITADSSSNWDWRTPFNANLWQGVSGVNNPCPSGYRVPTMSELLNEANSWATWPAEPTTMDGFVNLKMTATLHRYTDGTILNVPYSGFYYTTNAWPLFNAVIFGPTSTSPWLPGSAAGQAVRCIKD